MEAAAYLRTLVLDGKNEIIGKTARVGDTQFRILECGFRRKPFPDREVVEFYVGTGPLVAERHEWAAPIEDIILKTSTSRMSLRTDISNVVIIS